MITENSVLQKKVGQSFGGLYQWEKYEDSTYDFSVSIAKETLKKCGKNFNFSEYKNFEFDKSIISTENKLVVRYFNKWGWLFDRERRTMNRKILEEIREMSVITKRHGKE